MSAIKMEGVDFSKLVGSYYVRKSLGSGGSASVFLGEHCQTKEEVALKLIAKGNLSASKLKQFVNTETSILQSLSHTNVIEILDVDWSATYFDSRGNEKECVLIALELSQNYDLFDYIKYTGPFDEKLARSLFKSLLDAVAHCHENFVFHRDLKLENLVIGQDYKLKVIDFGLAKACSSDNELLTTKVGTEGGGYMAPEIVGGRPYRGSSCDIWSLGVVCFIFLTGHPPFESSSGHDWYFQAISRKRFDRFWAAHLRSSPVLSEAAMDFLSSILQACPSDRASISEMREHAWLRNEDFLLDEEQVAARLSERKCEIDRIKGS
eukprot:CAMPEP_0206400714 /NCGR_PEP_ID=MMETSP0294-20121207/25736_1 /ASSEMBLY_ACC=CAM_ASM_000327 /TAXON_ID=39354 /ORGANISM="Heterosigma akashiwo, Strain CCMP2393" /LENGTH=321 /DNA_ID=CAMNT_0053857071 /DNA_START=36 /DNA_END=1001 /DNA_ORIENTATION=-